MIEPVPTPIPDYFLRVQFIGLAWAGLSMAITAVLIYVWLPIGFAVPTFIVVAGLLLPIFWPLYRSHHPRRED